MKMQSYCKVLVVIILAAAVPLAFAQKQSGPKYDKANEIKVKGTVEELKEGPTKDTHLILKTDKGPMEICLCPAKFLTEMDVNFQKGDDIEVTGAKAKDGDQEVVVAREIVKGTNTLVLRDKDGGPVWTWLMK